MPGVGPELAEQLRGTLALDSLEDLEIAAHDGRLEQVRGVGPRRAQGIRAALAKLFGRRESRETIRTRAPSVATLLEVDREHRRRETAGELHQIAPRRLNPNRDRWLPVLRTDRGGWRFTALCSNTHRAHALGRKFDWLVVSFRNAAGESGQCTVVTERRGDDRGRRVVRGRELECNQLYRRFLRRARAAPSDLTTPIDDGRSRASERTDRRPAGECSQRQRTR